MVEVEDNDDLAETQNRLQDIAEDEDKNIAVDASTLPKPENRTKSLLHPKHLLLMRPLAGEWSRESRCYLTRLHLQPVLVRPLLRASMKKQSSLMRFCNPCLLLSSIAA